MEKRHEGLLEAVDVEANQAPWTEATTWKPATQLRLRTKRVLHLTTAIIWRILSPFWPKSSHPPETLRKTAWLDGLRGFAAFLVYWHHHQIWAHDDSASRKHLFEDGFGYGGHYHLAAFPGIRIFFQGGHFAVSTFFIISGYVLSTKPLSLIQEREYLKLGDNIASALFRRWLRLFIPLIVTTFLYMSSWHALGIWVFGMEPKGSWTDEVWCYYVELKSFSFVFKEGGKPWFTYNYHTWSIPVEFRGSIAIYTALLAFSRVSKNARLWCECTLIFYFMYIVDGWYCAFFISGMLLCDLDLLASKKQLPAFLTKLGPYKEFIYYHLLIISLYLGSIPGRDNKVETLAKQRGWYYLSLLKPQAVFDYKWFYLMFAATFFVAAVPRIRPLKSFFETRFCQYLGRISFALYLVHGPVLSTLGDRLYTAVGWHREDQLVNLHHWVNKFELPKYGPLGLELSFLVPHVILLPVTIWLAEIVTRLIDEPTVKFAQWLYQRMLPRPVKE